MQIIKIGKASSNEIYKDFKDDPTVSRFHCEIFVDDEGNKFLTDLDSTNGTFVNGNKISEPVQLGRFDIVRAGNSLVKWKEYLMDKDQEIYDVDETSAEYDNPDDFSAENIKPIKKKNYWWIIIVIIVLVFMIKQCASSINYDTDVNTSVQNDRDTKLGGQDKLEYDAEQERNERLNAQEEERKRKERLKAQELERKEREQLVMKYSNNSLYNGATPYSYCYGNNPDCYPSSGYAECSSVKVIAPYNSDVLVFIKKNNQPYAHAYIKAGKSYKLKLNDGTYQPFFYYGKGWNPEKYMKSANCGTIRGGFVSGEVFGKDLPQEIIGHLTYTLQLTANGNFSTKSSNKEEAF